MQYDYSSYGKKRDARWKKHNPDKAERAEKLRDSAIESEKRAIATAVIKTIFTINTGRIEDTTINSETFE